ncbi:MAG: hypothetical protein EA416_01420 [Trueperaceae bacterium]|nr:MAG: hypothetical protein EA416_01420 [Trueperaceae bacterium]
MLPSRAYHTHRSLLDDPLAARLVQRVCVRPPYLALTDVRVEGARMRAEARAESPAFSELGPMPAAEIGRHAAIAGLLHAAAGQRDDDRRYYLAREASCAYVAAEAAYGTPVTFESEVVELSKRVCRAHVDATVGAAPLARVELTYAILTEAAFARLFRTRAKSTPPAPNPYGSLLATDFESGPDWAEQVVPSLPVASCVGHFDGHPALPVAQLMGQLSYLAGRLVDGGARPYRVVRGEIEADDLAWAGERATFRVRRVEAAPHAGADHCFDCVALADEREVGRMRLWIASVREAARRV